jgi:hypothetical protein
MTGQIDDVAEDDQRFIACSEVSLFPRRHQAYYCITNRLVGVVTRCEEMDEEVVVGGFDG